MPLLNDLEAKSFDATRTYGDVVHFVHVHVIEPHPLAPDPSPYKGNVWELEFTTIAQPLNYEDRVATAVEVESLIEGNQVLLVDELDPDGLVNPVWCTYGPAANSAHLIAQDGTIALAQLWLDAAAVEAAIDDLLAP